MVDAWKTKMLRAGCTLKPTAEEEAAQEAAAQQALAAQLNTLAAQPKPKP